MRAKEPIDNERPKTRLARARFAGVDELHPPFALARLERQLCIWSFGKRNFHSLEFPISERWALLVSTGMVELDHLLNDGYFRKIGPRQSRSPTVV